MAIATPAAVIGASQRTDSQNGAWLAALSASYQFEQNPGPASFLAVPAIVESLTPAIIRETLARHANMENYVRVTLLPEQ